MRDNALNSSSIWKLTLHPSPLWNHSEWAENVRALFPFHCFQCLHSDTFQFAWCISFLYKYTSRRPFTRRLHEPHHHSIHGAAAAVAAIQYINTFRSLFFSSALLILWIYRGKYLNAQNYHVDISLIHVMYWTREAMENCQWKDTKIVLKHIHASTVRMRRLKTENGPPNTQFQMCCIFSYWNIYRLSALYGSLWWIHATFHIHTSNIKFSNCIKPTYIINV